MARSSEGEKSRRPSALQRAIQQAIGDGGSVGHAEDPAREEWPELWEWLTATGDPDGEYILQPATVTIQLGPEGVLASVTHRDLHRSCGAACPFLKDALAALQSVLSQPNPPIRSWGKDEPVLRKRRKKS